MTIVTMTHSPRMMETYKWRTRARRGIEVRKWGANINMYVTTVPIRSIRQGYALHSCRNFHFGISQKWPLHPFFFGNYFVSELLLSFLLCCKLPAEAQWFIYISWKTAIIPTAIWRIMKKSNSQNSKNWCEDWCDSRHNWQHLLILTSNYFLEVFVTYINLFKALADFFSNFSSFFEPFFYCPYEFGTWLKWMLHPLHFGDFEGTVTCYCRIDRIGTVLLSQRVQLEWIMAPTNIRNK